MKSLKSQNLKSRPKLNKVSQKWTCAKRESELKKGSLRPKNTPGLNKHLALAQKYSVDKLIAVDELTRV